MLCKFEDCGKPTAPADGEFCVQHSKKLATPYSSKLANDERRELKSAKAAKNGINTSVDFAKFMSGLMSDLVEEKISPEIANAACKAGDALLKIVELRLRHGFKGEALELSASSDGLAEPANFKIEGKKTKQ